MLLDTDTARSKSILANSMVYVIPHWEFPPCPPQHDALRPLPSPESVVSHPSLPTPSPSTPSPSTTASDLDEVFFTVDVCEVLEALNFAEALERMCDALCASSTISRGSLLSLMTSSEVSAFEKVKVFQGLTQRAAKVGPQCVCRLIVSNCRQVSHDAPRPASNLHSRTHAHTLRACR